MNWLKLLLKSCIKIISDMLYSQLLGSSDVGGGEFFIQEECVLIFYWVGYFFKFPPPKVTNIFADIFLVVYLRMHKIYMKEKSLAFCWKKKKKVEGIEAKY